ncbi:MAG: peptidase M16 [bacterium]|nr:MAG: peptidase M16 [bacterium]
MTEIIPDYSIDRLDNGFSIIKMPAPGRSLTASIWVKSGSANESIRHGIFHFIEHMFFKGTKNRTALDIAKEIEGLGGYSNAFTSKEYTAYYIKSLGEYGNHITEVLTDMFFNSIFDEKEIERERQVIKEEISMTNDDPSSLVYDLFFENILDDKQLSHPIAGTHQSVSTIKRDDFIDTLNSFYTPENCFALFVGDLSSIKWEEIKKQFSNWSNDNKIVPVKSAAYKSGTFKHKKDLNQVNFVLGFPAFKKDDKRRYALSLLNSVVGGSMSSRMFQEIREKRGLAYAIYSSYSGFRNNGIFYIYCGTNNANFEKTVDLAKGEIKKIKTDGITSEELERAKRYFKGTFLISMENNESIMQHAAISHIYHKEIEPVDLIIKKIESVKTKEVNDLACEIFDENRITLTGLGNFDSHK